jgi:hypothetical protein
MLPWRTAAHRFWQGCAGTAAIEMALLSPLLIFSLLAAYDLGNAVQQRMKIAHVVRVGVERGSEQPSSVPEATAVATILAHMSVAAGTDQVLLRAERLCACPNSDLNYVSCLLPCSGGVANFVFYRLEASQTFSGFFLPAMPMRTTRLLQIR